MSRTNKITCRERDCHELHRLSPRTVKTVRRDKDYHGFHRLFSRTIGSAERPRACPRKNVCGAQANSYTGFTVIEVMMVLGLTGLLLVGVLSGTFSTISRQRYTDSVRSLAEYFRQVYGEVISPESLGSGNSNSYAVLGKALVIGYEYSDSPDDTRSIYSATIVGNPLIPETITGDFVDELATVGAELFCGREIAGVELESSVWRYDPLWQSELMQVNDPSHSPALSAKNRFTGTVIIARSPSGGGVHTVVTTKTYDLRDSCKDASASAASSQFKKDISDFVADRSASTQFKFEDVGFCVKNTDTNHFREVRLNKDGRNTSAVNILDADAEDNRCK